MRLVGLTGGIATGKTTFAAALRDLGAPVVDADQLARAAVAKGSPGLAARVFADPAARARLEAIVHPAVRALFREELARLAAAGHAVAVYDVPLLFEAGLDREVDLAVVVWAPREAQIARLAERDGLGRVEAEARLAAQLRSEERRVGK